MRRNTANVQKLDMSSSKFISLLQMAKLLREVRETWIFKGWGIRFTRKHVERTAHMGDSTDARS
jgi:hypothetical protein